METGAALPDEMGVAVSASWKREMVNIVGISRRFDPCGGPLGGQKGLNSGFDLLLCDAQVD